MPALCHNYQEQKKKTIYYDNMRKMQHNKNVI